MADEIKANPNEDKPFYEFGSKMHFLLRRLLAKAVGYVRRLMGGFGRQGRL